MKLFVIFALILCITLTHALTKPRKFSRKYLKNDFYNEIDTVHNAYKAWKDDGTRIVTFGLSWCKKAWRSKFAFMDFIKASEGNAQGWPYHYINCDKFKEEGKGTCKGLYNNFLDHADPKHKFLDYRAPRTFCIKRHGDKIKVRPITKTGRLHSAERKDQAYFNRWIAKCKNM